MEFRDLEQPLRTDRRYDLVLSLEVAEHLSPGRAAGFVADLCGLGDLVLFSAAIPAQGGIGHVNEQWQSYWVGLFAAKGFEPVDAVRPLIWSRDEIPWWYRQNTILYARRGSGAAAALTAQQLVASPIVDMVHPDMLAQSHEVRPLRAIGRVVKRNLNRLGLRL